MASYKKQIAFLIASVMICAVFFLAIYLEVKKRSIEELNVRQTVYAKIAATGIDAFFDHQRITLNYLAQNEHIIRLDSQGKDLIQSFQKISFQDIKGVTRVNAHGRILYSFPKVPGTIGSNISKQKHVQEILRTHKPVISDIFTSVQGFQAIAMHMPVYRGRIFDGTIAFLISFDDLARSYLGHIQINNYRYARLINAQGTIIYSPVPGHIGQNAFEMYKNSANITAMFSDMIKGNQGSVSYTDNNDKEYMAPGTKHAVYLPVDIGNTFWSIAVASSEDIFLVPMKGFKNYLIILILALFLIFATIAYIAARIRAANLEQQKQRRIEEDILNSAQEVHDLYHNAPCGYHSLDPNGNIIRMNDTELTWLGYTREELIGKPFKNILSSDARRIFDLSFPKLVDKGTITELAYDMIRKDRSTFPVLINASALKDEAGRFIMSRSMVLDMTSRKQAEDRLRESEKLYRTALETTSDGVSILQNGKYVYMNQRFLTTLGIPQDYPGPGSQPLGILIHPDDLEMIRAYYEKRLRGEATPGKHDVRVLKPDQAMIYLQVTSVDIIYKGKPALLSFLQDITERRRVEDALRESEALYRTALEESNDGVSIIQDGKYVYANQKLLNTLGRPDENMIGQPLGIFIHPDDQELVIKIVAARVKGEPAPSCYELRAVKPDNSIIILNITAVLITYRGKPAAFAYIQDITARKQTEVALQESEALYRTAMETTNDGITIVQDGKYVYVNQRLLNTIGRPNENMIGQPLGIFIHPDDREFVKKRNQDRLQGEPVPSNYDLRVLKPDKSIAIVSLNVAQTIYKGRPAVVTFIQDITERKRAEETLRQSEERYRTIIQSIEDDYFETNLAGNVIFLNKPYNLAGYSREELIRMDNRQYTTPEMAQKIYRVFNKIYKDGNPARITDYEIVHKNGEIIHLDVSVSLIRDAEGKPIGFRGLSRDVSERIKMDEERKKLTEQLYQAQKMEAIGTLAGGIAHDFNNLLMGIQGYASLMLLEVDEKHPYSEKLKAVQTLVQSGANLTKQLLGFARAGRYEVMATNLNDLISKSVSLFGRTRKEIRIFEKYAENIWAVEADRGQLEQVLLNIFVNAWQAMPGGGSLYLATENVVFDDTPAKIYDLKVGRYVKTSITDTGVGMDQKTRQRIFDPFFTTKEMGRGTGLGLASAYGIIKGHGGMITVYSEKGQGTTFNIYLPASLKEVAAEEHKERELTSGQETILLVDDEKVITEVTSKLLEELGYTVITAGSGDEAIAIYRQKHASIDLVIVDMIMPGMNGSDTFDALQAINPSVRAILSSGYSLNGKAQAIMDKGIRVFLQKPYLLDELSKKIREALSQRATGSK